MAHYKASSSSRRVFAERTNTTPSETSAVDPTRSRATTLLKSWLIPGKRSSPLDEIDRHPIKRVKVSESPLDSNSDSELGNSEEEELCKPPPLKRAWRSRLHCSRHPLSYSGRPLASTLPLLQSLVSSHKSDIFRCLSMNDNDSCLVPAYCCAYPDSAREGLSTHFAVGTEQGTVFIFDSRKREEWDPEPSYKLIRQHNNGIFDIKWNGDDTLLATAAGDLTARVTDAKMGHIIRTFRHDATVKCISWNPNHTSLFGTGSRLGTIALWDLRESSGKPVLNVSAAHEENSSRAKRRAQKRSTSSPTVTGLLYSDGNEHQLISSGSADGVLRSWDLRQLNGRSPKSSVSCLASSSEDPTTMEGTRRPRGIVSLSDRPGTGPTAGLVFALGADSHIHTYARDTLAPTGNSFTHPNLRTNFYVKLSTSACGRWLASGGARLDGSESSSAFVFDVDSQGQRRTGHQSSNALELKGSGDGDSGGLDWAEGMLATCWDQGVVRIWRPEAQSHRSCLDNPENSRWDWLWAQ
ncbi:unnamed protein product [Mycena citricolor]|uniref:Anaphase-promoting complex subunit 4-like WD40 domain-containing protein n=1 Tax=Mycena citricolor TaxID=2018698 RepID=A0AAD2K2X5_9AGAR|nr:unnamed protein product [Mycena citricolor]